MLPDNVLEMVEIFVLNNANVNIPDHTGRTPLMQAAEEGDAFTAEGLIQHGANLDLKDKLGRTAGDLASAKGHTDVRDIIEAYRLRLNPFLREEGKATRRGYPTTLQSWLE